MLVRKYDNKDINSMVTIWNEVVENGVAVDDNAVVCISVKTGNRLSITGKRTWI